MPENPQKQKIDIGAPLLAWEVDEYPKYIRSRSWYIIMVVFGAALIIYSIATANFLFAIIVLMTVFIMLLSTFKNPGRVSILITTTGLVVSDMYYDFEAISDFSIVYEPPEIKNLYFDFVSPWQPILSIPLEEMNPNDVREYLLPFCAENLERTEEELTDMVRRLYKL